jgi:hypothetical protein
LLYSEVSQVKEFYTNLKRTPKSSVFMSHMSRKSTVRALNSCG